MENTFDGTIQHRIEICITLIDMQSFRKSARKARDHTALLSKPLVGFFAPANEEEEPDLDQVVCFVFDGSAGFVMHKGVWHEQPFPLEAQTKAVCVLRNETVRELKPTDEVTHECHGQDIDKLNLEARHNLIFTTDAAAAAALLPSCTRSGKRRRLQ